MLTTPHHYDTSPTSNSMGQDAPVIVLWDYENCAVPTNMPGQVAASKLTELGMRYGRVKSISAYGTIAVVPHLVREQLQVNGVRMVDGSTLQNRKDVVDKLVMTDMFLFAMDHDAPATIILVSVDVDYSASIAALKMRGYQIILVHPQAASRQLRLVSSASFEWYNILFGAHERNLPPSTLFETQAHPTIASKVILSSVQRRATLFPAATPSSSSSALLPTMAPNLTPLADPTGALASNPVASIVTNAISAPDTRPDSASESTLSPSSSQSSSPTEEFNLLCETTPDVVQNQLEDSDGEAEGEKTAAGLPMSSPPSPPNVWSLLSSPAYFLRSGLVDVRPKPSLHSLPPHPSPSLPQLPHLHSPQVHHYPWEVNTLEEFLKACVSLAESDPSNAGRRIVRCLASRVGIELQKLFPRGWRKGHMKALIQEAVRTGCMDTDGDGGYFAVVMNIPAVKRILATKAAAASSSSSSYSRNNSPKTHFNTSINHNSNINIDSNINSNINNSNTNITTTTTTAATTSECSTTLPV